MTKFSMAPNRTLASLVVAFLAIGWLNGFAKQPLDNNPRAAVSQPNAVVLSVRFKEWVHPRLRIGDGGRTQVCIPAVDSLNRLFGCQAVRPRFSNSQQGRTMSGSREYLLFLGTDASFAAVRAAYLGLGCFDFILDETQIAGEGGWYGRIKDTGVNALGGDQTLPVINARVLYVRLKANSPVSVHLAEDGIAEVGLPEVDAISHQYGCIAVGKRFKGKAPRYEYDADLSYIFQFSRDIDVHQAKNEYLATWAFDYIEVVSSVSNVFKVE